MGEEIIKKLFGFKSKQEPETQEELSFQINNNIGFIDYLGHKEIHFTYKDSKHYYYKINVELDDFLKSFKPEVREIMKFENRDKRQHKACLAMYVITHKKDWVPTV